jgi:hypothetical protein
MPENMTSQQVEPLPLAGALTIRDMPQIHVRMRDILATHAAMAIDCRAVTEMDLSFLQLVLSARKTAAAARKGLSFIPPATGVLSDTLGRAGLAGPELPQFWFNEVSDSGEDRSDDR